MKKTPKYALTLIFILVVILTFSMFLTLMLNDKKEKKSYLIGAIEFSNLLKGFQIDKIHVFEIRNQRTQTFVKFDFESSINPEISKVIFIDRSFDIALKSSYNVDKNAIAELGIDFSDNCHLVVCENGETLIFDNDWKSVILALNRNN